MNVIGKTQFFEVGQAGFIVKQPDDGSLSMDGGENGQALVDQVDLAVGLEHDPAFLGDVVAIG